MQALGMPLHVQTVCWRPTYRVDIPSWHVWSGWAVQAGACDHQCRQCRDSKLRNKLALSFMWRTAHNLKRRKKGVVNTKQSAHTSILSRGLLSPQGCLGRLNFFKHHCHCLCMFLWSLSYGLTTRLWSLQFRPIQSSDLLVPSTSEMSVANWLETKGSTSHWRAQHWLWVGHQEVLGSAPDLQLPLDCFSFFFFPPKVLQLCLTVRFLQ